MKLRGLSHSKPKTLNHYKTSYRPEQERPESALKTLSPARVFNLGRRLYLQLRGLELVGWDFRA